MTIRFLCLCLLASSLVSPLLWAQPRFQDATDILNQPGVLPDAVLGASAVDVNQDGLVDIARSGKLYFNQGTGFISNLGSTGIVARTDATEGITWSDVNADGLIDALVLATGGGNAVLYLNLGNGRFERVSGFTATGRGGIWGDFDNDGHLDLFMAGDGQATIHINQGNTQFEARGSMAVPPFICGAAAADYDRDGDLDVFLGGCDLRPDRFGPAPPMQNALLRNEGNAQFREVAQQVGLLSSIDTENQNETKGIAWFDYNNDGWLDLYEVSDQRVGTFFGNGVNRLFRNNQDGTFSNVTAEAGLFGGSRDRNGSVVTGDFDNDGWIDVYLGVLESRPDRFFLNQGDGTFVAGGGSLGIATHNPTALVTADVNNDGWLDLFSGFSLGDRLWINEGGTNHWLAVETRSASANTYGIGARVEVVAQGQRYTRVIQSALGGASQSYNFTAHFGLGAASIADSVIVYWPSGTVDRLSNVEADQMLTVAEGVGINVPPQVMLDAPRDNGRIDLQEETVTFTWLSTDGGGDNLTYNFYLRGLGIDSTFQNLTEASLTVPTSLLRRNEIYSWNVTVTDGFSLRRSAVQRFTFGEPPVPDLQIVAFPLLEVYAGSIDIGDFDGDTDPDLVITGRTEGGSATSVFRLDDIVLEQVIEQDTFYTPTQQYQAIPGALPGTADGGAAWADVDGDNDLDLLLHGVSSSGDITAPQSRLFRNVNNIYGENTEVSFPGVVHSHAAWGDYDGDGDPDLLLSGATSEHPPYEPITHLYQNTEGRFSEVPIDVPGFFLSQADWGDYDGDGDLDFAIMGAIAQGVFEVHVYQNNGGGSFARANVALEGLGWGSVDWGDYDADGDLDLLLSGSQLDPQLLRGRTQIYENDGSGQLVPLMNEITQGVFGKARWGDYDLDGDLDLVAMGARTPLVDPSTVLYRNNEGRFVLDLTLVGFLYSDLLFDDYNGDGDVDVIMIGRDFEQKPELRFFMNCLNPEFLPQNLVGDNGGC